MSMRADGRWRLYYHGLRVKGGSACGIGLALTDRESSEEFEGIRVAFSKRPQS